MTPKADTNDSWQQCSPGTLQGYAHRLNAKRRRQTAGQIAGITVVLAAVVGLAWFASDRAATREYHFGGIACHEVRANVEAFSRGDMPEELADKMRIHLQKCPLCQEVVREMREAETSAGGAATMPDDVHRSFSYKQLVEDRAHPPFFTATHSYIIALGQH